MDALTQALLRVNTENAAAVQTVVDTYAREKVKPFRSQQWYPLKIYRDAAGNKHTYDGGLNYDDGLRYDVGQTLPIFIYAIPPTIADIAFICNSVTNPAVILTNGTDFYIENGKIFSSVDLFDFAEFIQSSDDATDGDAADHVQVWLHGVQQDAGDMYKLFGYLTRIKRASSESYHRIVNAYLDCLVAGSTTHTVLNFIAACLGEPRALGDDEVVLHTYTTPDYAVVITNRHVYKHCAENTTIVAVNDTLREGQWLSDAVTTYPSLVAADLPAASVPLNFLAACFTQPILLENRDVPLRISTQDGLTRLDWDMPGDPATVKQFFDYIHSQGVLATQRSTDCEPLSEIVTGVAVDGSVITYAKGTLAHYLDRRVQLASEPTTSTLPTTINPYKLIAANLLQQNLPVVRLRATASTVNHQLDILQLVWKLLPAQVSIYFVLEFSIQSEDIPSTFIAEDVNTMGVMAVDTEEVTPVSVDVSDIEFRLI